MITEGDIEEYLPNEPAPCVSCAVIFPKSDSSLRIIPDAHNLNKALISSNYPTPHQENIRTPLSRANCFSKLDYKSLFWELGLNTES